MLSMLPNLRPFGGIPKKIQILFGRSLKTWKTLLKSLYMVSNLLNTIIQVIIYINLKILFYFRKVLFQWNVYWL